jgi:hypothetical protein
LFSGGILVALSHKINSLLCNTCTKCNIKWQIRKILIFLGLMILWI